MMGNITRFQNLQLSPYFSENDASGCIGVKTNINLGIAIEIFGTILGLILCATLALYASVARLSVVELIIYIGFWTAATVIAELIRRP